ncbi:MAG: YbaN family protein [Proteobacteria bacterium]|nr:YbaN family protein [Pseudomonadota bacterium]
MRNTVYKLLGFLFLGLAIAGVLLPVVPATPFLLLAAWFFARSSERWHQRLLNSKMFGPIIRNWETNRCIGLRTKIVSIVLMLGMGGTSIVFAVENITIKLTALVFMAIGCITLLSIKTCPDNCATDNSQGSRIN